MHNLISKKIFLSLAFTATALLAQGCAGSAKSTGVVTISPDTYRVTAQGTLGVPAKSRELALAQADKFCAEKGGSMQVTETGKAPLTGPYEVTFRCPANDDTESTDTVTKKSPSAVAPIR